MSFANLDRRRYEYVLSLGADDDELVRFFAESRAKLILNGGKVQNLPQGHKARGRAIAQLPSGTDRTVSNWFRENLTMADPMSSADIVEEFSLHEQLRESPSEAEAKRLCRSCLVHIFAISPPDDLMAFLRTPIGGGSESAAGDAAENRAAPEIAARPITAESVADVVLSLMEGRDVDAALDNLPPDLATFIQALQMAQRGDRQHAKGLSGALQEQPALFARLSDYLERLEQRKGDAADGRRGVVVRPSPDFSGDFDLTSDAVVGYCTNSDKPTAVFIRPIAVLRRGDVLRLRPNDAERLFPESGDLIAFSGPGRPQQPTRGDIGVWTVEEHDTDRKTHFHITSEKRSLHEVMRVPFPSTDPDSVRHFMIVNAKASSSCVYELEDGLIVASRPERPDLTREDAYELGLRAWESLNGFRIEGRLFATGPLPQEHLFFECAPLQAIARAVLLGRGTSAGLLTKAQIRELARELEEEQGGKTRQGLLRVGKQLEQIAGNADLLDALVARARELPDAKTLVDQEVSREILRRVAQRDDLASELARLGKEKEQEEERIRKLRDDQRRLKDETAKAVRAVFERAKSTGIASVLAEAALYGAVNGSQHPVIQPSAGESLAQLSAAPFIRLSEASAPAETADTVFKRFGFSKQRSAAFTILSQLARASSLLLELRGRTSSQLLLALAEAGALGRRTCLVDATLGLTTDSAVRQMLHEHAECDSIVLRDADLSPIELYARQLVDHCLLEMTGSRAVSSRLVCFNRSGSVAALPVSDQVSRISLVFEIDTPLQVLSELGSDEDITDSLVPAMLSEAMGILPIAADRLGAEILKLGTDQRRVLFSGLQVHQGEGRR